MRAFNLQGAALNTTVHNLVSNEPLNEGCSAPPYSTDWSFGGPIIEREGIAIDCLRLAGIIDGWVAALSSPTTWEDEEFVEEYCGPTPLIAAMRCYVASKMGEEINIPERVSSI